MKLPRRARGVGVIATAMAHSRAMTNTASSGNAPPMLEFRGFTRPIVVRIDAALMGELAFLVAEWPWRRVDAARRWHVRLVAADSGYVLSERRGRMIVESFYPTAPQAMGAFLGALIAAALYQNRAAFSLHAGAASFSRGAVVVLGPSMAGKSSVALHMAANGGRLIGDDSVAVSDGRALSFGLAPKLRMPLPEDAGRLFRDFANGRIRRVQSDIAHLRLRRGEGARFGQGAKLRGIIILKRMAEGKPRTLPADRPTAVRALVTHAFAPQIKAAALVAHLAALASWTPAYTLEFSRSRDAARALRRLVEGG